MDLDALDKALAEKVMGWYAEKLGVSDYADVLFWFESQPNNLNKVHVPVSRWRPTRDRGQAMQVFEQLPGYWSLSHEADRTWLVSNDQECKSMPIEDLVLESATTFKLAICLAAAKKYGIEVT